ncbi:hypothetical protein L228DRAFT_237585 [Xylona heveae TC161]|uniref:MPN domain-containing protein n=1 Tax=Xylona heveae (strain CBS 132557 / TC161) TaxID=1328760 RepID=A0A165IBR7_XYLHT|nr:hypothetical protein L228DRAFT_237585 [Xylona heveae TC161]KZF24680.1 hypothetical protein L228DRAFT_237585 [Xylona heveae TC161]
MDLSELPAAQRPMSVEQLVKAAQDFDYNPLIPLRYWLRTADTLLKEARIYELEGNDQQAYLLLFRHAQLVLGHLTDHPDGRLKENRQALTEAKKAVNRNLAKLEVLKPRINKRYQRYEELVRAREDLRKASANPSDHQYDGCDISTLSRTPLDPAAIAPRTLAASENKDLAVELAHKEIRRRQTLRRAVRQAGISSQEEHERRTAGIWGDWEEALARHGQPRDKDDVSQRVQETRRYMDQMNRISSAQGRDMDDAAPRSRLPASQSAYQYPSVPAKSAHESWTPSTVSSPSHTSPHNIDPLPLRPPKELPNDRSDYFVPLRPEKTPIQSASPTPPPLPPFSTASPPPAPPKADLNPSTFTFKPAAYLENGTPLRTIFLPPNLRSVFLDIAAPNTRANLETCGILCGTLISNALFISKLVIPEQESTSDTCETVNESALFDYCDSEDLMVLGWIHTHPSQTCFMSSRDLHTHCGYQVMMPESIAIVCAPSKEPSWGVFRLTDPPGLKTILNCRQPGLFHPHGEGNIYTDALRPGHVFEAKGLEFEVVDLRPSR